jgi:hypothetical protein
MADQPGHGEQEPQLAEQDAEEDEQEDSESVDEETNRRGFGIHQALPVSDGEPDWDAGALLAWFMLTVLRHASNAAAHIYCSNCNHYPLTSTCLWLCDTCRAARFS